MIALALFLVFLGILIKYGKMYFLLAGYNTLPTEEKGKYDIEGIASVFRNTMFGMALILLAGHFVAEWLDNPDIENIHFTEVF